MRARNPLRASSSLAHTTTKQHTQNQHTQTHPPTHRHFLLPLPLCAVPTDSPALQPVPVLWLCEGAAELEVVELGVVHRHTGLVHHGAAVAGRHGQHALVARPTEAARG
jgi:hypothetical protein